MEFNAIRVHVEGTQVDVIIPLAFLQLFTLVSDGKAVMHLVRDSSRGGPGACYNPMDIAATSHAISKEDYEMLTDVLFKFKQNPMKFEGHRVLTREDWSAIISQPDEDLLTTEAVQAIGANGQSAEIKFRDIRGNVHRCQFAHIEPWTERRALMPQGWDPEYWIRTTSAPEPILSRENSVQVPYSEYKRITELVIKFRAHPADAEMAVRGGVLKSDNIITFLDETDTVQHAKLGDINVWYTSGSNGDRPGFYVYLGSDTDEMNAGNSIKVTTSEAQRLRSVLAIMREANQPSADAINRQAI